MADGFPDAASSTRPAAHPATSFWRSAAISRLRFSAATFLSLVALAGCSTANSGPHHTVARFYLESSAENAVHVQLSPTAEKIGVNQQPLITEYNYSDVAVTQSAVGAGLRFKLTPAAIRAVHDLVEANATARIVLLIDNKPVGAARLVQAFDGFGLAVLVGIEPDKLARIAEEVRQTAATVK
jgi:hypothetical protein